MSEDLDPGRVIAQFALAELRHIDHLIVRAQRQVEALVEAEDVREALRERLLVDPDMARVADRVVRDRMLAFPSENDIEIAAIAIWRNHYRSTPWEAAPEILRARPLSDATVALEAMRGRIPAHP